VGLVQEIAFIDAVKDRVSLELYPLEDYHTQPSPDPAEEKPGVGVVTVIGEIFSIGADGQDDSGAYWQQLEWAAEAEHVKSVVLLIDSPGGVVDIADRLWDKIRALNERKPVIVSMNSIAASAGYYIASPARKIFAFPSTLTGSIGVFSMLPKGPYVTEKWGIHVAHFSEGGRPGLYNPMSTLQPGDRHMLEQQVQDSYQLFLNRVAEGRKSSVDVIKSVAEGRVWTGAAAKEQGLVDELGGFFAALASAKKEASLSENEVAPLYLWEPERFGGCLSRGISHCLRSFKEDAIGLVFPEASKGLTKFWLWAESLTTSSPRHHVLALSPIVRP
jgi:protease-4